MANVKKLRQKELIKLLTKESNKVLDDRYYVTEKQIGVVLGTLSDIIIKNVKKNVQVPLTRIGIFSRLRSKARKGINPSTGEAIKVSAKFVPRFKASNVLKRHVKSPKSS